MRVALIPGLVLLAALAVACTSSSSHDVPGFERVAGAPQSTDSICSFGVCWVDYDNDSYPDLFVANWPVHDNNGYAAFAARNLGAEDSLRLDALFHNNGDGTLTQVPTAASGIVSYSLGCVWGHFDSDGRPDAVTAGFGVLSGQPVRVHRNVGDGAFTSELLDIGSNVHVSCVDYDLDGDLDLFVSSHAVRDTLGAFIYRNDGGRLTRVDVTALGMVREDVGAPAWADFDNDGDPDLVYGRNRRTARFWVNNGDGTFAAADNAVTRDSTGAFCWGDFDNDGDLDLCGGDDGSLSLALFTNDGRGGFTRSLVDTADTVSGVMRKPHWVDYDNDGDLDLFVAKNRSPYEPATDALYDNDGSGCFREVQCGALVADSISSGGAAWADYDRDGDLDVYVTSNDATPNALYRNNGSSNNWLQIKCVGARSNRSGIGAKVRVKARVDGNDTWQLREITSPSGFFSQNEPVAHFGLGEAAVADSVRIEWPGGGIQTLPGVQANQFVVITEE